MAVRIRPTETRFIGWYAIQRANLADWFRRRAAHTPTSAGATEERRETHKEKQGDSDKKEEDNNENRHKLEDAVEESHGILAYARTVFPFTLFPDTITIDRHKLTVVHKRFFGAEQAASVPIENIKNIQADMGPIFGSITITSDHFVNNTQTLNYLRRGDVKKIQKLVQGITMATSEGIDLSEVQTSKLNDMLMELGQGHTEDI
jgi:hypothetical protein